MKTDENVDKARPLLENQHCLSIRMTAEELNMDEETVTQITTINFNIIKVWAKTVSSKLNKGQKFKLNLC
jgi:hypothetical protein